MKFINQDSMRKSNSKTTFTSDELTEIISLVSELEQADQVKQKRIREKIRKIGLYWSEVTPPKTPYNVANLKMLFDKDVLKVSEVSSGVISPRKSAQEVAKEDSSFSLPMSTGILQVVSGGSGRKSSDEHYIIDLCDEVLGQRANRQHRFDFLRGDTGMTLPVDAYYPGLDLVIEYYESQHTKSTPFFDRKQTVSGVSRGEQRRMYDRRRQELLPQFGIKLVIISYSDFGMSKKLVRNRERDILIIREILIKANVLS